MELMNFNSFSEHLNEANKEGTYSFGCAMIYFDFPEMSDLHAQIDEADVYSPEDGSHGLEDEPHVTLLYGLHSQEIEDSDVESTLKDFDVDDIKFHNVSLFENEKFDVLKFDAIGETLHSINKELTDNYPFTTDYPDYHPHATIGYLKPGMGKKYVELFQDTEYSMTPEKYVYSKPDGEQIEIPIGNKED